MTKTYVGKVLDVADKSIQYDEHAKNLLSAKIILAHILKYSLEEVKSMSVQKIMDCISDRVDVSKIAVNPGESNQPEKVVGDNVESIIPYEGKITYDLRFHLHLQNRNLQEIKLLVNLEAQKDFNKPYKFVTRGIFYGARMISEQLDTEFSDSRYQKIKKVYSIWICMNAPQYIGNAMTLYNIGKNDLVGKTPNHVEAYDKLAVILIFLNEKNKNRKNNIFHLLNTLFTVEMSQEEKKKILKEDFDIDTEAEKEIGEELEQMCNLSEAIEEKGMEKGVEKGEGLFATLAERLINDNRMDDLKKVTVDKVSREKLYKEYGLKTVG